MRIRYDLYIEFEERQTGEDPGKLAVKIAKDAFGEGLMGVSASSFHEDNYILTAMLYLDPSLILSTFKQRFPAKLPNDTEERLEEKLEGYEDSALQRVKD